jgi:hypothetical protein
MAPGLVASLPQKHHNLLALCPKFLVTAGVVEMALIQRMTLCFVLQMPR